MSNSIQDELVQPGHCQVRASADATELALTFQFRDRNPLVVALPLDSAAGLQRDLAYSLYVLGVRPTGAAAPEGERGVAEPRPVPYVPFPWFGHPTRST